MIHRIVRGKVASKDAHRAFSKLSAGDGAAVSEMATKQAVLVEDVRTYKKNFLLAGSILAGTLIAYPIHTHTVEIGMQQLEKTVESQKEEIKALTKAVDMAKSEKSRVKELTVALEAAKIECAAFQSQLEVERARKLTFMEHLSAMFGVGKK